jgi:hypothetical protein
VKADPTEVRAEAERDEVDLLFVAAERYVISVQQSSITSISKM